MCLATRVFTVLLLLAGLTFMPVDTPAAQARTSCNGGSAVPTPANLPQIERSTLCLINVQRRAHGLHRVGSNSLLRLAAIRHSREMVNQRYFDHTSRDGRNFVARIRQTGYLQGARFWRAGENLAWGVDTNSAPGAIVRAWMNSPPHRRTLLTPGFRSVGVGVIPGSPRLRGRGATYTTDFGYRQG
jgi:uncharacterized protein YkwD